MGKPIDDLYELILPVLARNGIEDTTENRFLALVECSKVWNSGEFSIATMPYLAALDQEIMRLRLKLKFPGVFKAMGL